MRFLIDNQLPPALGHWLMSQGHLAQHTGELNLEQAKDTLLWDFCLQNVAVLVTKDHDFAHLTAQRTFGPQVVWLRFSNMRRASLLIRFRLVFPSILAALQAGKRLVEVDDPCA